MERVQREGGREGWDGKEGVSEKGRVREKGCCGIYRELGIIMCIIILSFLPQRGKWAAYVPSAPQSNVHFYSCPTGYCRCRHDNSINNNTCVYSYSHGDPDLQCECDRRGEEIL